MLFIVTTITSTVHINNLVATLSNCEVSNIFLKKKWFFFKDYTNSTLIFSNWALGFESSRKKIDDTQLKLHCYYVSISLFNNMAWEQED